MALTASEKLAQRYPLAKELVERGEAKPAVVQAVDLLLEGKVLREIADELGVGRSLAAALLADPTGERARERRHRNYGICEDCGARTYSGGAVEVPARCATCAPKAVRRATRERIISAIKEWNRRYGAPPTALDWNVAQARAKAHPERLALIQARHREADWPDVSTVQKAFGRWNAAIEAAGFEPTPSGQRADPESWRRHLSSPRRGRSYMPTPKEVIAREIEKNNERRERLQQQIERIDADNRQLAEAQKVIDRMPEAAAA